MLSCLLIFSGFEGRTIHGDSNITDVSLRQRKDSAFCGYNARSKKKQLVL